MYGYGAHLRLLPGGLGQVETRAFHTLPPRLAQIVAEELTDPEAREGIAELLRTPNPAATIAQELSREIAEVAAKPPGGLDGFGLGELGRFKFKKVLHKVISIHKKVFKKVILPYVLPIAGAVLAPFTGGASLAAVAAIQAGAKIYYAKQAAKQAKKENKREAAAMEAQVQQQEAAANKEIDGVYEQYKNLFAKAGVTDDMWYKFTYNQKVAALENVSKGQPVGQVPPPDTIQPTGAPSGYVPSGYAPSGYAPSGYAPGGAPPGAPPEGAPPEEAPPEGAPPEHLPPAPAGAPVGKYEAYVEGAKVGEKETLAEIIAIVDDKAGVGDRFEIFFNGKSTGLKIRTATGIINVPAEAEADVRRLTHAEVLNLVIKATGEASKGGGLPWWLVAAPVAVFAIAA